MTKLHYFVVIATVFIAGCSTPAAKEKIAADPQTARSNANAGIVNQPIAKIPDQTPVAANTETAVNADRVVIGDSLVSEKNARKWQEKANKPKSSQPMSGSIAKLSSPAPDNSEIFSEMDAKGQPLETRVFKSHRQIAKIERLYVTMTNPTITVYLKNGKKTVVPNGRIGDPLTDSADVILKAVEQN